MHPTLRRRDRTQVCLRFGSRRIRRSWRWIICECVHYTAISNGSGTDCDRPNGNNNIAVAAAAMKAESENVCVCYGMAQKSNGMARTTGDGFGGWLADPLEWLLTSSVSTRKTTHHVHMCMMTTTTASAAVYLAYIFCTDKNTRCCAMRRHAMAHERRLFAVADDHTDSLSTGELERGGAWNARSYYRTVSIINLRTTLLQHSSPPTPPSFSLSLAVSPEKRAQQVRFSHAV